MIFDTGNSPFLMSVEKRVGAEDVAYQMCPFDADFKHFRDVEYKQFRARRQGLVKHRRERFVKHPTA